MNSLITAFNENARQPMPRLILIVIEEEFFRMINHIDYGVSLMIGKCLEWMISTIERIVRVRKIDVFHQRKGAVIYFEPKIVWLKMMEIEPQNNSMKGVLVKKFNSILEQCLARSEIRFMMRNIRYHRNLFDHNQRLTHEGRIEFWRHVSETIKEFDAQKEELNHSIKIKGMGDDRR